MKIHLTRDSVAIGDDIDAPHFLEIVVDGDVTPLGLAKEIQGMKYLAYIGSGEATWSVVTEDPVAIIAQQWKEPRLISSKNSSLNDLAKGGELLKVHIHYHCEEDPEKVLEKLQNENSAGAT